MTDPTDTSANVATDSNIGVQAQTVHGDVTVYQLASDPSPKEKYEVGVCYLDGGMPTRARQLISEAVMLGYVTGEARFHRLLALLSGRTLQQLSPEDLSELRAARVQSPNQAYGPWNDGLRVINHLLDAVKDPDANIDVILKEFDALGQGQRARILRHLEPFLQGPLKNQLWSRAIKRVEVERMAHQRQDRVWRFFQPQPARPRVRQPSPVTITTVTWLCAGAGTGIFVAAAGYLGMLIVWGGIRAFPILAYLLSIFSGSACLWYGMEWRYRVERRRAQDKVYLMPRQRITHAPPGGFASVVDRLFNQYFNRYVPRNTTRQSWMEGTAGIRQSLRNKTVEAYRETRVDAQTIAWYIRHQVVVVRQQWEAGTFLAYRDQLRTPMSTRAAFILGLAILTPSSACAIGGALLASPLRGAAATILVTANGWMAVSAWLRVIVERRRFAAESEETARRVESSHAAYERWLRKLARKPDDSEMAGWLDCDCKYLLAQAMRHYQLAPSDVIAHAFIAAPGASRKKARVAKGPWRFSAYRLLVFMLTVEGVRQVRVDLDFENGVFHDQERANFRFDAIAAVRVAETDDDRRNLELALVNGNVVSVQLTEPDIAQSQFGEDPHAVTEATMDASGLTNTLHILEGIAAEGRAWLSDKGQRGSLVGPKNHVSCSSAKRDTDSRDAE